MHRIKMYPWLGTACVLAIALACNRAPSAPTSPASAVTEDGNAAPDGSTLKVTAPGLVSPIGDFRLTDRRPTMLITSASGKFVGGTYRYEFQLMNDAGSVIATITQNPSGASATWSYPTDLERDTAYRWRARAVLDGAVGPWSATGRFLTVRENRTPDPAPGQRLPNPNMFHIVNQVTQQNPGILRNSCQETDHVGGWRWLDAVIDALRQIDTRWGYNCKRGNCNDPSLDVIVYHWGPGPDQGSPNVYAYDILLGHCGPNPQPVWIDITDPNGAGARFTSRGRW